MSIDIEREISDIRNLAEENNRILKSLQRKSRITFFFVIIKWAFIVAVLLGIYSFLRPIIDQLIATYSTLTESAAAITEIKANIPNLKGLFGN